MLHERWTQLPSNQALSSFDVSHGEKQDEPPSDLFSFSFFPSLPPFSPPSFFTSSVLFHRGHAYQSGKRFTDSDWYSDNENSTSPFAQILLKSPPQWTDPAFFPTGNQAITSFLFHPLPCFCFDVAAGEKSPSSPSQLSWPNIIRVDFHYQPFVDPPFSSPSSSFMTQILFLRFEKIEEIYSRSMQLDRR